MVLTFGGEGHYNDCAFFNASDLYTREDDFFFKGEHLLGDGEYRGGGRVVVPYNHSEARQGAEHRRFNTLLRSSRISVERGFGFICNKWKVFDGTWTYEKDDLVCSLSFS